MDERFASEIAAVCFDLDQTLYRDTPEIQHAVRNELYAVVSRHSGLSIDEARVAFQEHFQGLGSTSKTLAKFGVPSPREAVRDCLDRANVARFLEKDEHLYQLLCKIKQRSDTPLLYLITDSRQLTARRKLDALGITPAFDKLFCWDTQEANKSNRNIFGHIQGDLQRAPEDLVMVGNSPQDDIYFPSRLGWKTIHLSSPPCREATVGINAIYDLEQVLL